jgi:hypothetical protein
MGELMGCQVKSQYMERQSLYVDRNSSNLTFKLKETGYDEGKRGE